MSEAGLAGVLEPILRKVLGPCRLSDRRSKRRPAANQALHRSFFAPRAHCLREKVVWMLPKPLITLMAGASAEAVGHVQRCRLIAKFVDRLLDFAGSSYGLLGNRRMDGLVGNKQTGSRLGSASTYRRPTWQRTCAMAWHDSEAGLTVSRCPSSLFWLVHWHS